MATIAIGSILFIVVSDKCRLVARSDATNDKKIYFCGHEFSVRGAFLQAV